MPGGGGLYFETEDVTLYEDYAVPFTAEPGRYVKISIADTGVGMDEPIIILILLSLYNPGVSLHFPWALI